MSDFGDQLRAWRQSQDLTQAALAESLGLAVSRPTIANLEAGRSAPSAEFWSAFTLRFPPAEARLRAAYERAREEQLRRSVRRRQQRQPAKAPAPPAPEKLLGGPFVIERLDVVYVFRESRAPEEVLELRQLRATAQARDFTFKLEHQGTADFETETEVLWGGVLAAERRLAQIGRSRTVYLRRLDLGRTLKRSERHRFGIRYFVEHDPAPAHHIIATVTDRAEVVSLHVNFWGTKPPIDYWRFGPLADDALAPDAVTPQTRLRPDGNHCVSADFQRPEVGTSFGVAWQWDEDQ
ncbi:helix-turn-helix transcriptional regulator [Geodermatophilus sp. SYSU D01176]